MARTVLQVLIGRRHQITALVLLHLVLLHLALLHRDAPITQDLLTVAAERPPMDVRLRQPIRAAHGHTQRLGRVSQPRALRPRTSQGEAEVRTFRAETAQADTAAEAVIAANIDKPNLLVQIRH